LKDLPELAQFLEILRLMLLKQSKKLERFATKYIFGFKCGMVKVIGLL
jgi:hypothetical protein